ncbi:MAG: gliding motility-associated C-terminal domain-containing protein [Pyrinomonadaceae bacterium]|nr:gliding motility-associated C-terminal domain-containing protein [Sphingobacteriaceae bacterium]
MKKILVILLALSGYSELSKAQLTNSGQLIHLNGDAVITVNSSYIHKKDAVTNFSGTITNNGTLTVKENWTNDDPASVVFDKESQGLVDLSGDVQVIGGNSNTVFPSLTLSGSGDKWLASNIVIAGVLSLGDKQLHAEFNNVHIINPNVNAITGTGFISTDNYGALLRNTNSNAEYLFPMGSIKNSVTLYRPINFKPDNSLDNIFSATINYNDPGNDGFDHTRKRYDIQNVWDKYYFVLGQKSGNSKFNVTFFQNSKSEKNATQLVHWEKYYSVWGKASPSTVTGGSFGSDLAGDTLNTSVLYTAPESFQSMPFTFSSLSSTAGLNPFTFFNAFSPDGDGKNDTWYVKNIELYPDNKLTIFNRWGDEVYNAKGYSNEKGWDGADLSSGTYYYVLTANIDGTARIYKGFITLIKK